MTDHETNTDTETVAILKQRLAAAEDLLQQIHDCPIVWEPATIPSNIDVNNPQHRKQVVGVQHISYERIYKIAEFLHRSLPTNDGYEDE